MTAVLTTPIRGSVTFDSMIGTAIVSTERWLIGMSEMEDFMNPVLL
jgi:hypothetical protein